MVVVTVGASPHDGAGSICATLEFFWNCNVQGIDNGLCDIELGEVLHFICIVDGFGIAGELSVEANGAVWARIISIAYSAGCSARPR